MQKLRTTNNANGLGTVTLGTICLISGLMLIGLKLPVAIGVFLTLFGLRVLWVYCQ
jgi:ABC-type phosphate transport system permease subunit